MWVNWWAGGCHRCPTSFHPSKKNYKDYILTQEKCDTYYFHDIVIIVVNIDLLVREEA